jgi:hypothetical protein
LYACVFVEVSKLLIAEDQKRKLRFQPKHDQRIPELDMQAPHKCSVTLLGSPLWKRKYIIPYGDQETLHYLSHQLFQQGGLLPFRTHFYTTEGKYLDKRQLIPTTVNVLYEGGIATDLPDDFTLGEDHLPVDMKLNSLQFHEYPPFQPSKPIGSEKCKYFIIIFAVSLYTIFDKLFIFIPSSQSWISSWVS